MPPPPTGLPPLPEEISAQSSLEGTSKLSQAPYSGSVEGSDLFSDLDDAASFLGDLLESDDAAEVVGFSDTIEEPDSLLTDEENVVAESDSLVEDEPVDRADSTMETERDLGLDENSRIGAEDGPKADSELGSEAHSVAIENVQADSESDSGTEVSMAENVQEKTEETVFADDPWAAVESVEEERLGDEISTNDSEESVISEVDEDWREITPEEETDKTPIDAAAVAPDSAMNNFVAPPLSDGTAVMNYQPLDDTTHAAAIDSPSIPTPTIGTPALGISGSGVHMGAVTPEPLPVLTPTSSNDIEPTSHLNQKFQIKNLKGILSVERMTMTERMKEIGLNPVILVIVVYTLWYSVISLFAYISAGETTGWFGSTCGLWGVASCGDPWLEWWVGKRLLAELVWCAPFMAMLFLNPRSRVWAGQISDQLMLTAEQRQTAEAGIPSVRLRKLVFWLYIGYFFTWGAWTHYDIRSFGLAALFVLLPIYLIQAVLLADMISILASIRPLITHRDKIRIEPFEAQGAAGIDRIADPLSRLAWVPIIFSFTLIARSYMFLVLGGGEADSNRAMGEVAVAGSLILLAIGISMGPLFIVSGAVRNRKTELIEKLSKRCGFTSLTLESMLDTDIDQRKIADMILMERVQAIQPVDMKSMQMIIKKIAVPLLLIIGRSVIGS